MAKTGRPRGVNINPDALDDLLLRAAMNKAELCQAAGITPGHLADMVHRAKGASAATVRKLADVLGVKPGTLAPELTGRYVAVRSDDEAAA